MQKLQGIVSEVYIPKAVVNEQVLVKKEVPTFRSSVTPHIVARIPVIKAIKPLTVKQRVGRLVLAVTIATALISFPMVATLVLPNDEDKKEDPIRWEERTISQDETVWGILTEYTENEGVDVRELIRLTESYNNLKSAGKIKAGDIIYVPVVKEVK